MTRFTPLKFEESFIPSGLILCECDQIIFLRSWIKTCFKNLSTEIDGQFLPVSSSRIELSLGYLISRLSFQITSLAVEHVAERLG